MSERPRMDAVLLFAVLALVAFGLVMVYSASAVFAQAETGDPLFYFKRQPIPSVVRLRDFLLLKGIGFSQIIGLWNPNENMPGATRVRPEWERLLRLEAKESVTV